MTVSAFLAAAPIVRVVFGVAAKARIGRVFELLLNMARAALGFGVFAYQGKASRLVVEYGVGPVARVVAVGAVFTHR